MADTRMIDAHPHRTTTRAISIIDRLTRRMRAMVAYPFVAVVARCHRTINPTLPLLSPPWMIVRSNRRAVIASVAAAQCHPPPSKPRVRRVRSQHRTYQRARHHPHHTTEHARSRWMPRTMVRSMVNDRTPYQRIASRAYEMTTTTIAMTHTPTMTLKRSATKRKR